MLIAYKIDFKTEDCKKRQRKALYNDKRTNSTRGFNNCKYAHTQR